MISFKYINSSFMYAFISVQRRTYVQILMVQMQWKFQSMEVNQAK